MQKSSYHILAILFLSIMILPECNCEANKKGTPTPGYSETVNQSKENGVFQLEVKTDKSISIRDGGIEFEVGGKTSDWLVGGATCVIGNVVGKPLTPEINVRVGADVLVFG